MKLNPIYTTLTRNKKPFIISLLSKWWLYLSLYVICMIESANIAEDACWQWWLRGRGLLAVHAVSTLLYSNARKSLQPCAGRLDLVLSVAAMLSNRRYEKRELLP